MQQEEAKEGFLLKLNCKLSTPKFPYYVFFLKTIFSKTSFKYARLSGSAIIVDLGTVTSLYLLLLPHNKLLQNLVVSDSCKHLHSTKLECFIWVVLLGLLADITVI